MKIDNSPARGMRDLLPADVAVRDHVLESISAVYRRYGYQRIETPALENIARLSSGEGGDNEKLIFEVLRRGLPPEVAAGTPVRELVDLGLRYDLTVPLTRFYGNNHATLPTPFRSLQVGPVWRADRPQRGRYRQFYQCDIDMIGEPTVLAEAELIEATTEALAAIGLTGTTVRLSDRRFLAALASECGVPEAAQDGFFIVVDKLDKIGWDGVRAELLEAGFDAAQVTAAVDKIQGLTDVPADKLAGALAESVPGLPAAVAEDLAAVADSLDAAGRGARAELAVRPDAGARDGVLHRAGLRDHPPGDERFRGRRRAVRQADRALARPGRAGLRVLHRLRADRGPALGGDGPGRGRAAGRERRAGGRRGGGGAGAARRLLDPGVPRAGAWWRRCGGAGSSGPS